MVSMILASLMAPDLPAVSPVFTPTALLVTSAMVGCIGAAVLLLSRQQALDEAPIGAGENREEAPAETWEPESAADGRQPVAVAAGAAESPSAPVCVCKMEEAAETSGNGGGAAGKEAILRTLADHAERGGSGPSTGQLSGHSAGQSGGQSRTPSLGASALLAHAERLLPGSSGSQPASEAAFSAPARSAAFKPAARFSRSQQAFLRIPIVVSGRTETGAEFREETTTVILLPQGAVIHMEHRVHAGERVNVFSQPSQHEASCNVFGTLPGPDGKMLVEIEFEQQQRTFWPVSFPAWSGKSPANAAGERAPRAMASRRAPAADNSGS